MFTIYEDSSQLLDSSHMGCSYPSRETIRRTSVTESLDCIKDCAKFDFNFAQFSQKDNLRSCLTSPPDIYKPNSIDCESDSSIFPNFYDLSDIQHQSSFISSLPPLYMGSWKSPYGLEEIEITEDFFLLLP